MAEVYRDERQARRAQLARARADHLALLKRALELETIGGHSRDAFEGMLEDLTTEEPNRCAHAMPRWKRLVLSEKEVAWLLRSLGEDVPEPDNRLTDGEIPRGREVQMAPVLRAPLPKRPPGRAT